MKNKKGFTLVELLAVIVILAIILVIAIPQILKTINSSRLAAIKSSAEMLIDQGTKQYMIDQTETADASGDLSVVKYGGIGTKASGADRPCTFLTELSENDYATCEMTVSNEGVATLTEFTGKGKFKGYSCTGTKNNVVCNGPDGENSNSGSGSGSNTNSQVAGTAVYGGFSNVGDDNTEFYYGYAPSGKTYDSLDDAIDGNATTRCESINTPPTLSCINSVKGYLAYAPKAILDANGKIANIYIEFKYDGNVYTIEEDAYDANETVLENSGGNCSYDIADVDGIHCEYGDFRVYAERDGTIGASTWPSMSIYTYGYGMYENS